MDVVAICEALPWHIDRREWDRAEALFAERLELDYTSLQGGEPGEIAAAELIGGWRSQVGGLEATQHLTGNYRVEIEADHALSTCNVVAWHSYPEPHGGSLWIVGGWYRFELERGGSADEWKITAMQLNVSWASGNRNIMALALEAPFGGRR